MITGWPPPASMREGLPVTVNEALYAELKGQVALVTGASSGLGRQFAKTLALEGVKVAACARRRDKLDTLVEEIQAAGGVAMAVALDVADASTFSEVLDRIEAELGRVTILINNAGVSDNDQALTVPLDVIDQVLAVNVKAPFVLSREVAKRLIAAGSPGRIVNIASLGAFQFMVSRNSPAIYSVSKVAVLRITQTLSLEWAKHHINVNTISPGFFRSEMTQGYFDKYGEGVLDTLPRRRVGAPTDLDSTLLYLVSPASKMVTGACIQVDDGQMAI